jgi:hypothetical protein
VPYVDCCNRRHHEGICVTQCNALDGSRSGARSDICPISDAPPYQGKRLAGDSIVVDIESMPVTLAAEPAGFLRELLCLGLAAKVSGIPIWVAMRSSRRGQPRLISRILARNAEMSSGLWNAASASYA